MMYSRSHLVYISMQYASGFVKFICSEIVHLGKPTCRVVLNVNIGIDSGPIMLCIILNLTKPSAP
jgi:hypothetical protein